MGTQDRRLTALQPLVSSLESFRISLQKDLDSGKTIEARRRLGQFSTPSKLAYDIVNYGLSLNRNESVTFLDPAFGTGVFYSALIDTFGLDNIVDAKGIEVDPYYGIPTQRLWSDFDVDIQIDDFTKILPKKKYNFIICNPPYVRHHLIDSSEKLQIKDKTFQSSGVKLSGLAGLYCHFLLQSYQWMDDEGIAGWLVPSEFMDVNYGIEIKRFLLSKVELLRIHRFDPNDVQFDDALVSSAVVWFRKRKSFYSTNVEFSFGGTLEQPKIIKSFSINKLNKNDKWTSYPELDTKINENTYRLSEFFTVKRGIATGNNNFFIMDEAKIHALNLPFKFFRPILPSARYLHELEIFADNEGNPILPQKLFLLDCRLTEEKLKDSYPTLWKYILSGKETVARGYLCKNRKLWYLQEHRDAPQFICTYMGRDCGKSGSAFRFILNHSNAIVTNSYLALYPNKLLSHKLASNPELKKLVWKTLNSINSNSIIVEGRTYGGGLRKIEPSELLNVPIPESLINLIKSSNNQT